MRGQLIRRVHDYLRARLSSDFYPAGTYLNPRVIAEELDVSRTTVNKALDQLVVSGLAQRKGRRLVVVRFPSEVGNNSSHASFELIDDTARVYRAIRERMLHGGFVIGKSVNATKLAEELGASVQIVRQALNEATAAGMFERRPRRGWIAVQHTPREIQDIYRVRLALEPVVLRLAARRITDEQIGQLEQQVETLRKTADVSRSELREADFEFHHTFMVIAGHRILTGILDPMIHKLFLQPSVRSAADTLSEHAAILDAVRARNAEQAAEHLRVHLRNSRRSYVAAANTRATDPRSVFGRETEEEAMRVGHPIDA